MSGIPGQPGGGGNRKTAGQHLLAGTYRADRHANRLLQPRERGPRRPRVPLGLSEGSARLWRRFLFEFDFRTSPSLELLESALRSRDLAEQARATLEREGLTYTDSAGKPKAHPAAAIHRDARAAFVSTLRILGFPAEPE